MTPQVKDLSGGASKVLWTYRGCEDNVDGADTLPGHPYVGFATLDAGASSCHIFVSAVKTSGPSANCVGGPSDNCGGVPVHLARMGVMNIKRILKSRKIPFDHKEKQPVLATLLAEYVDGWVAPTTPGNGEKPKGPPAPEDALSAQAQATAEPQAVQPAEPKMAQPEAKRAKLEWAGT